jgi:hypothetical protein
VPKRISKRCVHARAARGEGTAREGRDRRANLRALKLNVYSIITSLWQHAEEAGSTPRAHACDWRSEGRGACVVHRSMHSKWTSHHRCMARLNAAERARGRPWQRRQLSCERDNELDWGRGRPAMSCMQCCFNCTGPGLPAWIVNTDACPDAKDYDIHAR